MAKRLGEYEPLEQSVLWLLKGVVHMQAVLGELYHQSFDEFDQKRRDSIEEGLKQINAAVDGALQALEARAGADERADR